jgi:hypothetical protein
VAGADRRPLIWSRCPSRRSCRAIAPKAVTDSRTVDRLVVEAALAWGFGVRLGASSVTGLPGGSPPVNEQPGQVRVGDDLRSLRKDLVHERVLDLRDRVSASVADDEKAIVAVCGVADR